MNNLLYIIKRLYILNTLKIKILIINKIYSFKLKRYINKFIIYTRINYYYF